MLEGSCIEVFMNQHAQEVLGHERFRFGENWKRFLRLICDARIRRAEKSLQNMLGVNDLVGKSFLDIGSGSGLFSLAAKRLGAQVHSFDYDPQSVACTLELKRRYFPNDNSWSIESGSALDESYLRGLGQFDVVYSWGVLHHTGQMWSALQNVNCLVKPGGQLFVSIYNDQGWISRYWTLVKKVYNRNLLLRVVVVLIHLPHQFVAPFIVRAGTNRWHPVRGMSLWHDLVDWLGGLPFEVARPQEIMAFYGAKGYELQQQKVCGTRHGCNEYVFRKL